MQYQFGPKGLKLYKACAHTYIYTRSVHVSIILKSYVLPPPLSFSSLQTPKTKHIFPKNDDVCFKASINYPEALGLNS